MSHVTAVLKENRIEHLPINSTLDEKTILNLLKAGGNLTIDRKQPVYPGDIEEKIISMYAKGMTTANIYSHLEYSAKVNSANKIAEKLKLK